MASVVETKVDAAVVETETLEEPGMCAYKNMSLAILRIFVRRCWLEWSQQCQSMSMNDAKGFYNQILLQLLSNSVTHPTYNSWLCP